MQDVLSPAVPAVAGRGSFASAARSVLEHLRAELGFELVMLTRREGPACIVLDVIDDHFGVQPGLVMPWERTFCARVSNGEAPRAAPDLDVIPALVETRADLRVEVGAYISVEVRGEDDEPFGTLCAASPHRQGPIQQHLPLMDLLARMLGRLLSHELRDERQARRVERAETEAATDMLTEVGNRRLWDRLLASEEARCRRYGSTAGIVVIDLDGLKEVNDLQGHRAGDALLRRTAEVIQDRVQESDLVARLGGDEFGVLLAETHADGVAAVVERLRVALQAAGIPASVGGGVRLANSTLAEAWRLADDGMYQSKRARRRAGQHLPVTMQGGPEAHVELELTRATIQERPDPLEPLVRTAREQLGLQVAFVSEITRDRQVFRSIVSTIPLPLGRGDERPLSETFCHKILTGDLPPVIPNTRALPAAAELAISALIGCYVAVPILLPDGSLYGTLCGFSCDPEPRLGERDVALLQALAKSAGELLAPSRQTEKRRHRVVEEIDAVLSAGGPAMRYQPIVCLETGLIAGVEALSTFPKDDQRTPAQWYADAALAGATIELELAAASTALALLPKLPGFLSINVSVETLCAPRFTRLLADQPLEQVVLELSEHDPIADYAPVLSALSPLRARGLRLAVDDAGAGFASLRHVLQLVPDLVKLDLSLVRDVATDPARQALATALLGFAAKIGATVIAEGIEIQQELAMLRELGVALGQGFLISRPLPADMWDGAVPGALPLPRTKVLAAH